MLERIRRKKNKIYPYDFYISILPPNYGEISSEDYEFKKELRYLMKNYRHKIILVSTNYPQNSSIKVLINSLNEVSFHPVQFIYLEDFNQGIPISLKQIVDQIMPKKEAFKCDDSIKKVMTPKIKLLTVNKDSSVSDAYLLMDQSGKRHCPVLDEEGKFIRMISRSDMSEKIPPMPDKIPMAVQISANLKLDPNAACRSLMDLVGQSVGQVFPIPTEKLVYLNDTSTINEAIEKFTIPYETVNAQGVKKTSYFTALPILNSQEEIEGIVSFIDIFRDFFINQIDFLNTPLYHLATMDESYQEPENHDPNIKIKKVSLTRLKAQSTFSNALMIMKLRGFRSLPIVDEEQDNKLIGFVSDSQIKMFSHKDFLSSLFNLPVSHFMTQKDDLSILGPDHVLDDIFDKFWTLDNNQQLPSSFAICDGNDKDQLLGVVSYVDILKYWLKYIANKKSVVKIDSGKATN